MMKAATRTTTSDSTIPIRLAAPTSLRIVNLLRARMAIELRPFSRIEFFT
jgi:hypothetical protein